MAKLTCQDASRQRSRGPGRPATRSKRRQPTDSTASHLPHTCGSVAPTDCLVGATVDANGSVWAQSQQSAFGRQHRRHCRRWRNGAGLWGSGRWRTRGSRHLPPSSTDLTPGATPAPRYDAGRNLSALAPLSANGHPSVPKAPRWVPTVVRRGALGFRPPGNTESLAPAPPPPENLFCPRRAGALTFTP